ncbi:hypothetical protein HHK36_031009 [Tetracentron sinense]|uniref:PXMP2/4 family protein 4 n=1 Tax=Tetracentron sinense TaxID=13715 RepID=A0A834YCR1_TETSI|nr:hypothetical protein HHK36_031009 [Tetracentron sinense]
MSGSFLRNGSKRCINRILDRRTILDFCVSTEAQQQQSRSYARSSSVFKKIKEFGISQSHCSSYFSSYYSPQVGFIGWYLGMINSRPLLTKSITSALIYTAADLSSQTITKPSSESFDSIRTLRMAGYGMLILGPSLHFWFNFVSKVLPKRDILTTFKKIIMGQTTYGPFMTVVFLSLNAGLQGENDAEIVARLKRDLFPTLISGLMYWPMCDFVTFKFIPVHLQSGEAPKLKAHIRFVQILQMERLSRVVTFEFHD